MEEKRYGVYSIRGAKENEWEEAMNLAWETFLIFQTKEYSKEGIKSFQEFVSSGELKKFFLEGIYQLFVAAKGEKIVGIITLRNQSHISLLFVDKEYQRDGLGSLLVEYLSYYVLDENNRDYLTVDAAPSAVEFYQKIGFFELAPMQSHQGISYIAMKKNLRYIRKERKTNERFF